MVLCGSVWLELLPGRASHFFSKGKVYETDRTPVFVLSERVDVLRNDEECVCVRVLQELNRLSCTICAAESEATFALFA